MCVVSMVIDHGTTHWPHDYVVGPAVPNLDRIELDKLRKEVEELKELIRKAKVIDVAIGQKDCEKPELVALVKKVAEAVGVDMEDLLNGYEGKTHES